MYQVKLTAEFSKWFNQLKDNLTKKRLAMRLRKAQLGNLGDVKPVGKGVWEMRELFGPGFRMYYVQHGQMVIVMLGGGDKSTQSADIERAVVLTQNLNVEGLENVL